jgi:hypothetical protein
MVDSEDPFVTFLELITRIYDVSEILKSDLISAVMCDAVAPPPSSPKRARLVLADITSTSLDNFVL